MAQERPSDPIVEILQDLEFLPTPPAPPEPPRDFLRETTVSDPELDKIGGVDGPRWIPVKLRIGLAAALATSGAIMAWRDTPWGERALMALAAVAVILGLTGAITLFDALAARRRRADRRPPLDFG